MNVGIESVIFMALLNDANLFVYYKKKGVTLRKFDIKTIEETLKL